jgi:isoleucyl-tRNA synthetase
MIAPFAPFMAEYFWKELALLKCGVSGNTYKFESVHLERLPKKLDIASTYLGQEGFEFIETLIEARGELRSKVLKSAKKPVCKQMIYVKNWRLIPVIEELQEVFQKEFNVVNIDMTCDYGTMIKYGYEIVMANFGKRFKDGAKEMKKKIAAYMTDEKFGLYIKNKTFMIDDIHFCEDDVRIVAKVDDAKVREGEYVQFYEENGIIIVSDLTWNDELQEIYWMKMITRHIMNFRKEKELVPTDRVVIIYKNLGKVEIVEKKETEMADFLGVVLCENYEEKLGGFIGNTTFHEDDVQYEFKLNLQKTL